MSLPISLQEAAHLLSVEDRTVRNWVHRIGIRTTQDSADARRRLITDDDLKLLANHFRRPLPPIALAEYNATHSATLATSEASPTPSASQATQGDAGANSVPRPAGADMQASDEEFQRVLKALAQLAAEVSDMRAKVDLLVQSAVAPTPAHDRPQPAADMSGETRPLRDTHELANVGG